MKPVCSADTILGEFELQSFQACLLQVVIGVGDPNPLVGGAGILTLEKAGISVSKIGAGLEKQCYDLNTDFMQRMERGWSIV